MNFHFSKTTLHVVLLLILFQGSIQAQRQVITVSPDAIFTLHELNVLILEENDQVNVKLLMPGTATSNLSEDQKLMIGDIILFANGKSINDLASLKAVYKALDIGEELRLGIQRKDEKRIISVKKQEKEDSSLTTFTMSGNTQKNNGSASANITQNLSLHRISSLGISVVNSDIGLLITHIHEETIHRDLKGKELKAFIITSINGKKPGSPEDLIKAYNDLNEGDELKLNLEKGSESKSITIIK